MSRDDKRAQHNAAYRLALAATLGLTLGTLCESMLPFMAPLIAVQFLAASRTPPTPKIVFLLLGVAGGTALVAHAVATLTLSIPGAYELGVAVLYLWGFGMAQSPRLRPIGTMMITMTVAVTSIATASSGAALFFVAELVASVVGGFVLVVAAHEVFPHPAGADAGDNAARDDVKEDVRIAPVLRAALATAVILPLHLYLNADGIAAMVILMTTAAMLRQPGLAQSLRYGFSYAAGNGLGGVLAALSALIYTLHGELILLASLTAATSLWIATLIVTSERLSQVFVPALVAYLMLFGMTLSSLPLGTDVAVATRVIQIIIAALYSLAAVSLLVPFCRRRASPASAAVSAH